MQLSRGKRKAPRIVSVLFSEPKIPQSFAPIHAVAAQIPFQCSSASRKFLNQCLPRDPRRPGRFQCSSASRKFLNVDLPHRPRRARGFQCSSASRKFLNAAPVPRPSRAAPFQCSSASRKFLNQFLPDARILKITGFSALQRAENSSIVTAPSTCYGWVVFQCSSASRKFLNRAAKRQPARPPRFQCSSASRKFLNTVGIYVLKPPKFLFQCSSASRKFLNREGDVEATLGIEVSVLFSEPKIPQSNWVGTRKPPLARFSALQRAENSSIWEPSVRGEVEPGFQCSSASRKFLNR